MSAFASPLSIISCAFSAFFSASSSVTVIYPSTSESLAFMLSEYSLQSSAALICFVSSISRREPSVCFLSSIYSLILSARLSDYHLRNYIAVSAGLCVAEQLLCGE